MIKTLLYILVLIIFGMVTPLSGENCDFNIDLIKNDDMISSITVFAGNDTSICHNSYLDLTMLGAYISGDVSDGIWISYGDGTFTPNNLVTEVFSIATGYTLGSNDIQNGSVTLVLVSDDPDGIGPETEVSDLLVITLIDQPAMACVGNISLSLDYNCTQTLAPGMLLTNPLEPLEYYEITSYDEDGQLVDDNILTADHIGQIISFEVGHSCGSVSCNGSVEVLDYHIPNLLCNDINVKCNEPLEVLDIGLPIPSSASIVSSSGNVFIIRDFDPCSDVTLSYGESIQQFNCSDPYTKIITRNWQVTDASDNTSYCTQKIYVERITLLDVVMPLNYDDNTLPSLICNSLIDTLPNGTPTINVTGEPYVGACSDIDVIYKDEIIPSCGTSFKIIRRWFIFDNCTNESIDHNQLIRVADTLAPIINCPNDTLMISTDAYTCRSNFEVPLLDYDDCSKAGLKISYITNYTADTIPINEVFTSVNVINQGDTLYYINQLPKGNTWIKYTMTDQCANKATCLRLLQVVDDVPPYVSCDKFTSINLTNNGIGRLYAETIDDESWDNCLSTVILEVQKMSDICGTNSSGYAPYVDFCCEEIGETIMVAMRATDEAGNFNICMVEVTISDKLPPTISAPDDITISCTNYYNPEDLSLFGKVVLEHSLIESIVVYDDYNNGVIGSDGIAEDNCEVIITEKVVFDIECEQGSIIRTFTATDGGGLTVSDQQVITIVNVDPFDEYDISWPQDKTYEGCAITEIDTSEYPTYVNIHCGEVSATYEDEIYEIVPDACVKIIRKWTVVDWCQYNKNHNTGKWTNNQIIKILNQSAPVILSSCRDTTYCLLENDCGNGRITIDLIAEDDCTPRSDLYYEWQLLDANRQVLNIGKTVPAIFDIGSGDYIIEWLVEDKCGNRSICDYSFDVKDCKLPTPYCLGNVVTTLMNNSEEIEIWASDFDLDSYDNCTAKEDLLFSFSKSITDKKRLYDCDDIENGIAQNFELELWVTDEFGNQDYCIVNLLVQDNQDYCDDQPTIGAIGGKVMTVGKDGVAGVEIDIDCIIDEYSSTIMTNASGEFIEASLLQEVYHSVRPFKDDELLDYVTTFDLLLIQRHIIRLDEFDSPYKLIGADINQSGNINIVDLIHLRKLLLGKYKSYPENTSWRFMREDYVFENIEEPWEFPDSIIYKSLNEEYLSTDFIGIKIGDVNSLYTAFTEPNTSSRSAIEVNQKSELLDDGTIKVSVFIDESYHLNGYQIQLLFDADKFEYISLADGSLNQLEDNYNFDNASEGVIRSLWIEGTEEHDGDNTLMSFIFKPIEEGEIFEFSLDDRYQNELYIDGKVESISLSPMTVSTDVSDLSEWSDIDIYPNPFVDYMVIDLKAYVGLVDKINIYDISGALIFSKKVNLEQTIKISGLVFPDSGNYLIQFIGEDDIHVRKLVKID